MCSRILRIETSGGPQNCPDPLSGWEIHNSLEGPRQHWKSAAEELVRVSHDNMRGSRRPLDVYSERGFPVQLHRVPLVGNCAIKHQVHANTYRGACIQMRHSIHAQRHHQGVADQACRFAPAENNVAGNRASHSVSEAALSLFPSVLQPPGTVDNSSAVRGSSGAECVADRK